MVVHRSWTILAVTTATSASTRWPRPPSRPARAPRWCPSGHSYGGYLGLAYAILQPQAVRGLVLVATGPGFRSERSRQRWNRGVDAYAARLELPAARLARQEDSLVLARLAEVVLPFLHRLT